MVGSSLQLGGRHPQKCVSILPQRLGDRDAIFPDEYISKGYVSSP